MSAASHPCREQTVRPSPHSISQTSVGKLLNRSILTFHFLLFIGGQVKPFPRSHRTTHGARFDDVPPARGALSVQLAFRVSPQAVAEGAPVLEGEGVRLISPPTDHPFGHRTIFFRDPDGNVLEIFAEI